jgi:hypothetical protein
MIDLSVPLFSIEGFTGGERFSPPSRPNPAMAGNIQAVPDIVIVNGGM